jgi:N-methylhydantoinase A
MGPFEAAEAICDVATANMYARLLPMMAQRGADPREFSLLAYGGAGPVHAFRIAGELGFKRVLIPPSPGTFCALGCLLADLRADFVASVYTDIDRMAENELAEVFGTLKTRAWDWVRAEGMSLSQATLALSADMRHSGQSYDIPVSFAAELSAGFRQQLREAFFASYKRIYGDPDRSGNVEIVNARAQVIVTTDKPILHPPPTDRTQLAATTRSVRHRGQELEACVYQRSSLSPGDRISGTAIVASYDSTTLVPPEAFVEVDSFGNLVGGVVGV